MSSPIMEQNIHLLVSLVSEYLKLFPSTIPLNLVIVF